MIRDRLTQAVAEAYKKMKQEELKGDQHKIDANKNGEIDAHDFHLLRKQKNEETEPKSEKEKDLAALGHPEDEITYKDVLIGRGVLKQEGWDSKKSAVSEANVEETELQEGKMAQLHADIEDAVGQHVKDYNSGKLGHDSFGEKVVAAHQKIAKLHGIEPKHAKKFVNDYVDQNMKEEFQLDEGTKSGDDSLHDWFSKSKSSDGKPGWVQLGGKYAGKPCAKQPGQTTKPKCGSSKMKRDLSKDEEDAAFRRKNEKDPNPERSGKAKMVATEEKDACYHKVKARYKIWPSAYASGALVKCRKVGADNWGNKSEEVEVNEMDKTQRPPGRGSENEYNPGGKEYVGKPIDRKKMSLDALNALKKSLPTMKKEEFDLNEGNDDVGEMIKDKLKIIINRAKEMHDGIGPNTDMPEWVKSKITLAQDYVSTACDYSCGSEQLGEEVNEGLLGSIAKGVAINVLGKMAANALMKKDDKKEKDQVDERCWDGYKPVEGKEAYSKGSCTKEELELNEKAASKEQQRFFGMVRAVQKGEMKAPSPEIAKAAAGMTKKAVKDYASTKHAGLPTRVIKDEVENIDELSKSTLGSYIKAASHDAATKSAHARAFADKSAAEKKKENFMQARKDDETSNKKFTQSWKRRQGIEKAVDRLTKEEMDQLQEVGYVHVPDTHGRGNRLDANMPREPSSKGIEMFPKPDPHQGRPGVIHLQQKRDALMSPSEKARETEVLKRLNQEEREISEDMGEPDIKVRQTYTKAYADHYKRALRLNPKGASRKAEVMAYDTVKMKHGDDAHDALKAYHEKNQNESYEQIDEELSSRAKLVKELYNKAKEMKKSKKDVFEADPEMEIMPSPQYSQPKK